MSENGDEKRAIVTLDWSSEKLLAMFGHLLTDDTFARGPGAQVEPEWFGTETALVKARLIQLKHLKEYGRLPTPDEVRSGPCLRNEPDDVRLLVGRAVDLALSARNRFGKDGLADEVRRWKKDLLFRSASQRAGQFYRQGQTEAAYSTMEELVQNVRQADQDLDQKHAWENWRQTLQSKRDEYQGALTWGHPLFDKKLCDESESGSLLRGKTTILVAGTNRGKSRCLATVVGHNALREEPILWLTHEDPEIDVSMNLWCFLLRKTPGELLAYGQTPEGAEQMDLLAVFIKKYVDFVFLPPTGLPVERVVASIRRRQETRLSEHGVGYSLLVDDYPAKLIAERVQGDLRHVQAYVYQQFIGLALEYNFHSLLAIQTNRTGHVVGKGRTGPKDTPRWIDDNDLNETFNPAQDAANVITLNRTKDLERRKITVFYFSKTKSSAAKGWAVACEGDYGKCVTHAPEMAATCFERDWMEPEKISDYLKAYNGQAVPEHVVGI